jgi:hypothetical protein
MLLTWDVKSPGGSGGAACGACPAAPAVGPDGPDGRLSAALPSPLGGRVRYDPADRAWFAVLTRFITRRRWAEVLPVTPATLLAWHRRPAVTTCWSGAGW